MEKSLRVLGGEEDHHSHSHSHSPAVGVSSAVESPSKDGLRPRKGTKDAPVEEQVVEKANAPSKLSYVASLICLNPTQHG
jgi:zinc transporter 7